MLCQRVPGRRLRGVHLVGRGRDAAGFEQALRLVDLRLGEGIVLGRVGGRLGSIGAWQREQPLRVTHQVVLDRRRLDEEDGMESELEDRRSAARRLWERVAVPVGDGRGGNGQQRAKRPKDEGDLVLGDQGLIVGDDLLRAAGVVDILHGHLVTEQATLRIDVLCPQVVSLLQGLSVAGEVAAERDRDPDRDGRRRRGRPAGAPAGSTRRKNQGEPCRDHRHGLAHAPSLPADTTCLGSCVCSLH